MFMWSAHDERNLHKRRYTAKQLYQLLERNGFQIVKLSYYNFFMFLPILIVKALEKIVIRLTRSDGKGIDNTKMPNRIINAFLKYVFSAEQFILRLTNLPFGVSIIAVARRPAGEK